MGQLMLVNPRKRRVTRKKPARKVIAKRRSAPVRRPRKGTATRVVRRRRNPIRSKGIVANQLTPALTAASGALGLDIILGFMPIPETLKSGPFRHIIKGVGAIGMGMLASNIVSKKTAEQMTTGALTVVMHSAMKEVAQTAMPNLQLGYYNPGYPVGVGEYVGLNGVGAYIPDSDQSTYLSADTLAKPFQGGSSAMETERRMVAECEGHG